MCVARAQHAAHTSGKHRAVETAGACSSGADPSRAGGDVVLLVDLMGLRDAINRGEGRI